MRRILSAVVAVMLVVAFAPTASATDSRSQSLLYNLAFILPLVVVFGLTYFGTTSEQLRIFIGRRTATIKLGTALLFLTLTGWLLTRLA